MTTQLKERPLVLTTEEVNAVLAGHKTQHRVPVLTAKEITKVLSGILVQRVIVLSV